MTFFRGSWDCCGSQRQADFRGMAETTPPRRLVMKARCAAKALAIGLLLLLPAVLRSQNVVADWDAIAANTIVTVGGAAPAASFIFFAYVDVAVYDAVNSIEHRDRPFALRVRAPRGASVDAAVITAAHDVLVHYYPLQQAALDADEDASLAAIPNSQAKTDGMTVGQAVAASWIDLRANDGVNAPITYVWGHGPGIWEPVPPFPPPVTPWMAYFIPFTYQSASDFLGTIDPPPSLTSKLWANDYNLTKEYGALNGSLRTPKQTEIGQFWAAHPGIQFSQALVVTDCRAPPQYCGIGASGGVAERQPRGCGGGLFQRQVSLCVLASVHGHS